jgi:hypothetical protein
MTVSFTAGANPATALARCLRPGRFFTTFLICLRPFCLPLRGTWPDRQPKMFHHGRCVFVHNFLQTLLNCLARFFFSIAMIQFPLNRIGHQQRFGRCCLIKIHGIVSDTLGGTERQSMVDSGLRQRLLDGVWRLSQVVSSAPQSSAQNPDSAAYAWTAQRPACPQLSVGGRKH